MQDARINIQMKEYNGVETWTAPEVSAESVIRPRLCFSLGTLAVTYSFSPEGASLLEEID